MVGEKMATGAPPRRRGIVWRRMVMGSIFDAIARPSNPPFRVLSTIDLTFVWRRNLR